MKALSVRILGLLVLIWPLSRGVHAYHAETTHAGITQVAAQGSGLHSWLKDTMHMDQGLWEQLSLKPRRMTRVRRWVLVQDLFRLNPVHGYAPSRNLENRATGWLTAGSVLEATPSSRIRHHFFDPRTGKGLRQKKGRLGYSAKVRLWDYFYGSGSLAGMLTGANFDLTGKSALKWALHSSNKYGLEAHFKHRHLAQTSKTLSKRRHHLVMSLLSMGALAHLVQKMACPSYVRNDYVVAHLERGSIPGGTPLARFTSKRYGRAGIPKAKGKGPFVSRFRDFFVNDKGTGLAQTTAENYYSPGTLPSLGEKKAPPEKTSKTKTDSSASKTLLSHLPGKLFQGLKPGEARYLRRKSTRPGFGPIRLLAYGKTPEGDKAVWMDRRVYADYAQELIPRATLSTKGLFRFLLRGRLSVRKVGEMFAVINTGVALGKGVVEIYAETKNEERTRVGRTPLNKKVAAKELAAKLSSKKLPTETRRVVAVFKGVDRQKEPLVGSGSWTAPPQRKD